MKIRKTIDSKCSQTQTFFLQCTVIKLDDIILKNRLSGESKIKINILNSFRRPLLNTRVLKQ